ncbi:O-antigen ligase family protein [Shewanella gaetbuli]
MGQNVVRSQRLNHIVVVLLCSILIWAPIPLGSNRIWALSLLELMIFSLGILHLVNCYRYNSLLVTYRWQKQIVLPFLLLIGYLCLQMLEWVPAIATVDSYQTSQQILKSVAYLVFAVLISEYCQSERHLRWLLVAIIISGCLQASYGTILNLLALEASPIFGYADGDRARGSFVYQNHFANYLGLCLCIAFGWLVSELKTHKSEFDISKLLVSALSTLFSRKLILRLSIIIMVIGLILSRSRMGNAGFFTALGVMSILALVIYRRPPTYLKPLVISIFILDLIIVGSIFGVEKVKQRIADTSFAAETRDQVVIDSIPIIKEHLLTGTGGGSFYAIFQNYQPQFYSGFYDHAHNEYIQFLVEYGVIITVLLGFWLIYALWLACRTMYLRNNKFYKGIAYGCAMAILFMLIHISVDFNLQAPANTLLFITILTLCWQVRYLPTIKNTN